MRSLSKVGYDQHPELDTNNDGVDDLDAIATREDRPALHELPTKKSKTDDEKDHVDRLVRILSRHQFEIVREASVYGHARDGSKWTGRPDLMVRHWEIPNVLGAIEVKSTAKSPDADQWSRGVSVDLVKQAADYVLCRCLASGDVVEWAAIYPVRGFHKIHTSLPRAVTGVMTSEQIWLSALMEIGSKHFKVHPLFHREHDGLTLGYLDRGVIWDERTGWRKNAAGMLCGKRQVGGVRR